MGSNSNGIEVAIGENNSLNIELAAGADVSVTGADSNAILLTHPTGVTTTAEVLIGEGSIASAEQAITITEDGAIDTELTIAGTVTRPDALDVAIDLADMGTTLSPLTLLRGRLVMLSCLAVRQPSLITSNESKSAGKAPLSLKATTSLRIPRLCPLLSWLALQWLMPTS